MNGPFPNRPHSPFREWGDLCHRLPGKAVGAEPPCYIFVTVVAVSNPPRCRDVGASPPSAPGRGAGGLGPVLGTLSAGPGGGEDRYLISALRVRAGTLQGLPTAGPGRAPVPAAAPAPGLAGRGEGGLGRKG